MRSNSTSDAFGPRIIIECWEVVSQSANSVQLRVRPCVSHPGHRAIREFFTGAMAGSIAYPSEIHPN